MQTLGYWAFFCIFAHSKAMPHCGIAVKRKE